MAASKIVSKKDIIKQGRKKKRQIAGRLALLWLVLFLILIVELVLLIRAPKFLIKEVVVEGASPYEKAKIEEAVKLSLFEKCPCLIPGSSVFLYSKKSLNKTIRLASPRVGEIIYKRAGQTLKIQVSERRPVALWCQGVRDDKNCFFLDSNGETIALAPVFSNHVMAEFYSASSTASVHTRPLENLNLQNVILLGDDVASLVNRHLKNSFQVNYIEPFSEGDLTLHFISSKTSSWSLLINKKTPPEIILSNLEALLSSTSFVEDAKDNSRLLYIDMRFDKKVFYKFQS